MDNLYKRYSCEMGKKLFAYDGDRLLYTIGQLPKTTFHFDVVLERASAQRFDSRKSRKKSSPSKKFKVEITYVDDIPISSLEGLQGGNNAEAALRVLNIILRRHHAAKRDCHLLRRSFFVDHRHQFDEISGRAAAWHGYHSSFQTTHGGLSLKMDLSSTIVLTPGPVLDFILRSQGVNDPHHINWAMAKTTLKNLRVKTSHNGAEFKIIGISEKVCEDQKFSWKRREDGTVKIDDISVYEYFLRQWGHESWQWNHELRKSRYLPCLAVGNPTQPAYLPIELCSLVSLQRYPEATLSTHQRALLVGKTTVKPRERTPAVTNAVTNYCCDDDDRMLKECGISIETEMATIKGRILCSPKLKFRNCVYTPVNGCWKFTPQNKLISPIDIKQWAVVNFSAHCDLKDLYRELADCGKKKGIKFFDPADMFEEDYKWSSSGPHLRVEKMFKKLHADKALPKFILCVLPKRKNCDIYGPWKKRSLEEGIITQCISPTTSKFDDQLLTNLLLKINSKLGGTNCLLADDHMQTLTRLNKDIPTMILGIDVSHGSPGQSDIPSIAAVVGSRSWPDISKYGASVRTQPPKVEIIDSLFKPLSDVQDDGIIRERIIDFFKSTKEWPHQIIIFRDGVSDTQFNQVLDIELEQISKACLLAYQNIHNNYSLKFIPKFTLIVAQKCHHTKLFRPGITSDNVLPGTVVDSQIVHPTNYDFFMCAHRGATGTSRPIHYHVLLDEIGFSVDELQNLVHSLSYIYERGTNAISIVAPIRYAHQVAAQMNHILQGDASPDSSNSQGIAPTGSDSVPKLRKLLMKVESTMFW